MRADKVLENICIFILSLVGLDNCEAPMAHKLNLPNVISHFMRLVINQTGRFLKIFDSKDLKTVLYSAEIFHDRKKELLKVFNSSDILVSTIRQTNYNFWFQTNWDCEYEINLAQSNTKFIVNCIKYLKRHWTATSVDNKIQLEYFGHNGHKKSIFNADTQIAKVDKDFVHLFNRDTIYIDLNNNENPLLILTFVLLFELSTDNDGSSITLDFGSVGQDREYDKSWKPK